MSYTPRLNSDGMLNNFHWYSSNPFYLAGYGLPNCTCYAFGRFWEIGDPNSDHSNYPNLSHNDADQWWQYNQTNQVYESGQTPQLGSIICFSHVQGLGAGHVAIVEEIHGNVIVTSNSSYGGQYFHLETLTPDNNGRYYHQGAVYQYVSQGFIYNPFADQPEPEPTQTKKKKGFVWPVAWNHWDNFKN